MARKDVLRLLRNLSRHTDLKQAYESSEKDRKRIIKENGGIDATETKMLLRRDKAEIKTYLDDDNDTAQQIQVV
jgi:hypothetical protein